MLMRDYETCRKALATFVSEYTGIQNRNEATTRLQLIDRLFLECLSWERSDFVAEPAYRGDYADYVAHAPRPVMIVEAKREGKAFELPAGSTQMEYSLPALTRDYPELAEAVEQVAAYCQKRGVLLATVANGHQLVSFVAVRHDSPPLDGRALVFPNLDFMLEHFQELWDALSKAGIEEKKLEARLLGRRSPQPPPKLSTTIAYYPGTKARNRFQTDLKIVSELVLEDVASAREVEQTFLKECYCDSGALSEYSLISRDILQNRYEALFDDGAPGPTTSPAVTKKGISPDLLAKSLSRRPILLLGDVGVGKTTFLRHLMTIDALEQFEQALAFHLNLGVQATLTSDLKLFVIAEIARQLRSQYDIDIEDAALVRGIYHGELQKFSRSIYGGLKASNPKAYEEKELAFLELKMADKPEHLKAALEHLEKGRKKQIILFLDNADQRDYKTQQEAFLIAQELAASGPATVFVTLRPESFHLSLRSGGTLSGYHPKAFTIAPPRIDRVIEKRLEFALKISRGEVPLQLYPHIQTQFSNLEEIICSMLSTLNDRRDVGELIDNIAAGNVRLALDLVQGFFGSGHVDTQKIVTIQKEQKHNPPYHIPLHEFLRAVMYGDTVHYDPTRSYVANLFDVSTFDVKEHFILPRVLSALSTWTGSGVHNGFVQTDLFYERVQSLGYTPDQIDYALVRAHKHNLVEMAGRRAPEPGTNIPPSVRATSDGIYHVEKLITMFAYVDAVIVDTPIFDADAREKIRDTLQLEERVFRAETFCTYLDKQWSAMDRGGVFDWGKTSHAIRKDIERVKLKALS